MEPGPATSLHLPSLTLGLKATGLSPGQAVEWLLGHYEIDLQTILSETDPADMPLEDWFAFLKSMTVRKAKRNFANAAKRAFTDCEWGMLQQQIGAHGLFCLPLSIDTGFRLGMAVLDPRDGSEWMIVRQEHLPASCLDDQGDDERQRIQAKAAFSPLTHSDENRARLAVLKQSWKAKLAWGDRLQISDGGRFP